MAGPWICFHCCEVCRTVEEGIEHFGGGPVAEALCKVANHPQRDLVRRVRRAERAYAREREGRESAEQDAWLALHRLRDLTRLFPGCLSPHDVWVAFDAVEGRAEAAEAILAQIDPLLVARARAIVCGDPVPA
jgi:hypothetical protein